MLKDLLLQFFISVIPVFILLLWHDKDGGWRGFTPFLALASGASILLCSLTSSTVFDYEVSLGIVPYLIGSLYGGYRAFYGLTLLYVVVRVPNIDSMLEMISFTVFMILFVTAMLALIRPFQSASATRKQGIGIAVILGVKLYLIALISLYFNQYDQILTTSMMFEGIMPAAGLLLGVSLSIFIVEGIKEKQLLLDKIKQLSANYSNEVEKLQQLIDKAPLAVMMVDRNGVITHANEESMKLLSLQPDCSTAADLKHKPFDAVFLNESGDGCAQLLRQALRGESTTAVPQFEAQKILLYTSVTLRDVTDHHISGAALIAQDMTELSHLRDEVGHMERLSLVGQMAASITHEIRNPMAVIRGFVQLMQERSAQNQFQYFRIIMEEIDRANTIINDFLSLAQNRELKMEMSTINVVLNDIVPLLDADANMRGQTLEVELSEHLPSILMNDREMKQMLLNLARNGMEAMGEKGVLRIVTACAGDEVSVHISDEGIGIPQENIKNLFEPFYTTKTRGTGLGLPLCLSIAERHGGRIDVKSREGEGTTFIVTFNIMNMNLVHNIV